MENQTNQIINEINNMGYKDKLTLNERQAALVLNASPSTLSSWRKNGLGPMFIKVAAGKKGRVMYPKSSIAEWILKNQIQTA